jgi:hypothetical protein
MSCSPGDLTPLPDLLHDAALAGPVRTRRPAYADLLPPCNRLAPVMQPAGTPTMLPGRAGTEGRAAARHGWLPLRNVVMTGATRAGLSISMR